MNDDFFGLRGSGSGGDITGSGTDGKVAKFSDTKEIEDSIISDDGMDATVGGGLTVTGALIANSSFQLASGSPISGQVLTADGSGNGTWQTIDKIDGSGATGTVPVFTAAKTLGNSVIVQSGSNVGVGTASPSAKLHVNGSLRIDTGSPTTGDVLTRDASGDAVWQAPASGGVTGSGTVDRIAKWTPSTGEVGNSIIDDDGSKATVNGDLIVDGDIKITGGTPGAGKVLKAINGDGDAEWEVALDEGAFIPGDPGSIAVVGNDQIVNGQQLFVGVSLPASGYDTFSGGAWNSTGGYIEINADAHYDISGTFMHRPDWMSSPSSDHYVTLAAVEYRTGRVICANTVFGAAQQVDLSLSCSSLGVPLADGDQVALFFLNALGQSLATWIDFTMLATLSVQRRR